MTDIDSTRRQRRLAVTLSVTSFTLLIGVAPLAFLSLAFVTPAAAATCGLGALSVQVLLALSSAHLLFIARESDRTRGQALCAWFGAGSVVLAVLGVLVAVAGALLVCFISSLGPWCGTCGT